MKIYDRVLLVFSNDLRVHDNPALNYASKVAVKLGCCYCKDARLDTSDGFGLKRSSTKRDTFLDESLYDLNKSLNALGQSLHLAEGTIEQTLLEIIDSEKVTAVVFSEHAGVYEKSYWSRLRKQAPQVDFHCITTSTLFDRDQLVFGETFPSTFSQFRRKVESTQVHACQSPPKSLPAGFFVPNKRLSQKPVPRTSSAAVGGERAALSHLDSYFAGTAPSTYKETRNELDGWQNSSKFSFWLACGNLSVRRLYQRLKEYEDENGENDSTYWIFFELLWREFFQWYAHYYKSRMFQFGGVREKSPLTSFYPERFKKWSQGRTPWPLVNALMRQLNDTGYMSNRGRQIVASALIHELALDWRCGAAYFEQELLDYDVASNWGNWQYIAGVGADPRGGRHFNIEKQHQIYDKDNEFVNKWTDAQESIATLDSVDQVDWPIE